MALRRWVVWARGGALGHKSVCHWMSQPALIGKQWQAPTAGGERILLAADSEPRVDL